MFAILAQRDFTFLWLGQLISRIGDTVRLVALPFYIYGLTGSALATGAMFMAQLLPPLLLGSFAGVLVDRWDRKRTMIISDILRAVCLLPLLAVSSQESLWILYTVALMLSIISVIFNPARRSLLPRLVDEKDLVAANSMDAVGDNVARLIGPSLGGIALAFGGLTSVILVDALSYILSALFISFIIGVSDTKSEPAEAEETGPAPQRPWARLWQEWLQGLEMLRSNRALTVLFVVVAISILGESVITVLIVPFVKDTLQVGALGFGWLLTARGLGGLIGGILVGHLGKTVSPARLLPMGLIGSGVVLLVFTWSQSLVLALVLLVLIGLPVMAVMISETTLLQILTPDSHRGRIFGIYETVLSLTMLIGMGLAGVLADIVGTRPILSTAALLFLVGGAVGFVSLRVDSPAEIPKNPLPAQPVPAEEI